ncbi:hypothetical protein AZE42_11531 [Rhizopogon vesiculosus]|uniref:Uncharacterized protein n=1 Tax=Rhizopogon vesiculosus TaxID=180088 RepID=A0A1J8PPS7_9AGAM|nr:hypothetical protein AZE42_11531 [Rhizopogon vesiculosus]
MYMEYITDDQPTTIITSVFQ